MVTYGQKKCREEIGNTKDGEMVKGKKQMENLQPEHRQVALSTTGGTLGEADGG